MLLFPCVVTFPESGSIVSVCKVYATPDGVDVWHWNADDGKAEVIAHGDALIEEHRDVWSLTCTDGTEARIVSDPKDCGCGHPMKWFRPAVPVRDHAPG